jgi:hypothetical protein
MLHARLGGGCGVGGVLITTQGARPRDAGVERRLHGGVARVAAVVVGHDVAAQVEIESKT